MRVSFSVPLKPDSGKQMFALRLAKALRKKGVAVSGKRPDVNIVVVKGVNKKCKNVLRLDGVWMNRRVDCKNKNEKLKNHLLECDGVIYQNEFCKDASDKMICKTPSPHAIIGNGIDPSVFSTISPHVRPKPYFLAMCNWRPHKRMADIVKGFLASNLNSEYELLVFGKTESKIKGKGVVYCGRQSNDKLLEALLGCVATIHLAFIDWCPNSVVESIIAKKPVLHTDSGGTKLVVKDDGVRIEDKPWKFNIIDLYKPPALDRDKIGEGYRKLLDLRPVQDRLDLHIDTIADQYIDFLRKVI